MLAVRSEELDQFDKRRNLLMALIVAAECAPEYERAFVGELLGAPECQPCHEVVLVRPFFGGIFDIRSANAEGTVTAREDGLSAFGDG